MKVVCIYDEGQICEPYVRKGEVYTVIRKYQRPIVGWCYDFAELKPNPEALVGACFPCAFFRPITDISVFQRLLVLKRQKEDA
jgi:hypothetical protein